MKVKIYGISNCGSVKKARIFFENHNIDYDFHDYKKLGIDAKTLKKWCTQFGWETVINKKGLTWRGLDETIKSKVINEDMAIKLMSDNNSIIKRPVLESDSGYAIGFNAEDYEKLCL